MMLTKLKVKFNMHNTEKKKMVSSVFDGQVILHVHFISYDSVVFIFAFFTVDIVVLFFVNCCIF